ncbi:MAG: deoxyguanosinetriphosphate triphosphohydrolase, partial [Planctomycetaceae bacterium]
WLASYAVRESQCGGRAVAEPEHSYRTCFQRDRDRVIHCSAFRRLDFKTQVFVPHEHDHFRTRMTHTLEVAQIGRTAGRALRLNEDMIETAALAHDLGHSPFGHGGEAVLDSLMAGHGGFEHNRQSLRVVDYLEHPYPHFRGLNLTNVVRECLAKHQTRYDRPVCPEFDLTLQPPLEGQIIDLADEIAYTSADLEDSLAAEWLTVEQLDGMALWRRAWAIAQADAPDARPIHKRIRACKAVLAAMADDLLTNTAKNLADARIETLDDVRHAGGRLVAFSPELGEQVRAVQDFLLHEVYIHPRAAEKDRQTRQIITDLFEAFTADPKLLPARYQSRIATDGLHRVTCDYIAGMTDRYCKEEHQKIVKP